MEPVGIVSIVVGALAVCTRVPLVVAPRPTLRWWKGTLGTNGRVRVLGAAMLPLLAAMVWAGSPSETGLEGFLFLVGLGGFAVVALLLVPFPGVFRALFEAIVPDDLQGSLIGWRMVALAVVVGGVFLIYLGVLAL